MATDWQKHLRDRMKTDEQRSAEDEVKARREAAALQTAIEEALIKAVRELRVVFEEAAPILTGEWSRQGLDTGIGGERGQGLWFIKASDHVSVQEAGTEIGRFRVKQAFGPSGMFVEYAPNGAGRAVPRMSMDVQADTRRIIEEWAERKGKFHR
jgi:hypothetical protein